MTTQTIIAETSEHTAFLTLSTRPELDGKVAVFRKHPGGTIVPMGDVGRWEKGIILGSGVNCGILVRLEGELREKSGTP